MTHFLFSHQVKSRIRRMKHLMLPKPRMLNPAPELSLLVRSLALCFYSPRFRGCHHYSPLLSIVFLAHSLFVFFLSYHFLCLHSLWCFVSRPSSIIPDVGFGIERLEYFEEILALRPWIILLTFYTFGQQTLSNTITSLRNYHLYE